MQGFISPRLKFYALKICDTKKGIVVEVIWSSPIYHVTKTQKYVNSKPIEKKVKKKLNVEDKEWTLREVEYFCYHYHT